jgi:hypothetical protein
VPAVAGHIQLVQTFEPAAQEGKEAFDRAQLAPSSVEGPAPDLRRVQGRPEPGRGRARSRGRTWMRR